MTEIIKKESSSLLRSLVKGDLTAKSLDEANFGYILGALAEGEDEAIYHLAEIASPETYQAVLEMALWNGDNFSSQAFLGWLAAINESDSLTSFAKLLKNLDFEYLELVIREKLIIYIPEEPEDNPPGEGFYSPDKGAVWIKFVEVNEDEKRLLGKALALLFQTEPRLFYHLMTSGSAPTRTELEELCYKKHLSRISELGFPDPEQAWEAHKLLGKTQALKLARGEATSIKTITTQLGDHLSGDLLAAYVEGSETTLAYLVNCAVVVHKTSILEITKVAEQVYGAINLGLEALCKEGLSLSEEDLDKDTVLVTAYRLGYSLLRELSKKAFRLKGNVVGEFSENLLSAFLKPFPLNIAAEETNAEHVTFSVKPFASVAELEKASGIIDKLDSASKENTKKAQNS